MKSTDLIEHLLQNEGRAFNLKFDKTIQLDFFGLEELIQQIPEITFENCTFDSRLTINNLDFNNKYITFKNCKLNGAQLTQWNNLKIFNLTFTECEINNIILYESEIKYCYFINCSITKMLNLSNLKSVFCEIINDHSKGLINSIICSSPDLDSLNVQTTFPIEKVRIDELKQLTVMSPIEEISITSTKFDRITIEKNEKDNSYYAINSFELGSSTFNGHIDIYDINIKKFKILNVNSSNGSFRLNEVKLRETGIIDSSILSFYWNQLEFIKPPELIRCDFSGLKMTNVKWDKTKKLKDTALDWKIPLLYGLRLNSIKKSELDYKIFEISEIQYQRDTYRQLKAASMANHNQIEALDFYRNEMRLYWKEIRINGGISLQNRLLVFLNRWSSDFGQNWILPIVWLFLFHALWFSCLLSFGFWSNSKTGTSEFAEYFKLLNPTHEVPNYVTTGFGYLTDIVMRVSIAYFVYHIIRATRKYGKV